MVYKGHDSLDNTNYSVQFSIILYNLYEKWELVTFLLHAFTTITGIADSTSSFTVSIGFGFQQLFHYLHIPSPESVSLPFRRCIPFWYLLLIRLVLSCCSPLLYPDQNPFAGGQVLSLHCRPLHPAAQVRCIIGLTFIATMGSSDFS